MFSLLKRISEKINLPAVNVTTNRWNHSNEQYRAENKIIYWELVPEVTHYQYESMTGDRHRAYAFYAIEKLKAIAGDVNLTGLSIGCGEGESPERLFCATGMFTKFDVMDIAQSLLQKQARIAQENGLLMLNYIHTDLNQVQFKPNSYDLIWAVGTIHHVEKLEEFFSQINSALSPRGLFICREYVGPSFLQLTDKQLRITNNFLQCIPEKYRRYANGALKERESRVDKQNLIAMDPSESIRSADIVPLLYNHLEVIQFSKTGGTILQPLLNGIAFNFIAAPADHYVKIAIDLEKRLINDEEIESDYIFVIAKKKA